MRASVVVALFAVIGLAGCSGSSTPSADPGSSSSADPAVDESCPSLVLRSPGGTNVDLTGRWRSPDGGNYYLRQSKSCVWFAGLSGDTGAPGAEDDSAWTNSFFGHLAPDFTLNGTWADLPWGRDRGVGVLTWRVNFAQVQGVETTQLDVIDVTGGFGAGFLVRPEAQVNLRGRLQDTSECAAFLAEDGETYQFAVLPLGWTFDPLPMLDGLNGAEVQLGDEFDVTGEVARGAGAGFCGPGLFLFVDTLTTGP